MGQIVGGAAKPKRCNLNKLSQLGTPAAGEHILVSSDNSMNAAGQGNFDCYIVGNGTKAATALELKYLDDSTHPYIVEEVNKAVADIQPIEITGDVTNAPDEEDLTSENQGGTDVLKFKDKAYNAALYSGLGRVYLRKNIITLEGTGKNVLTQAMVNTANTIYHIQYDYDLNGQTINLPAGCVLEFDGGSVKNGTLNFGNGVFISSKDVKIFDNITFTGDCGGQFFNIDWFVGNYTDGINESAPDSTNEIQAMFDSGIQKVWLTNHHSYRITRTIIVNSSITINGQVQKVGTNGNNNRNNNNYIFGKFDSPLLTIKALSGVTRGVDIQYVYLYRLMDETNVNIDNNYAVDIPTLYIDCSEGSIWGLSVFAIIDHNDFKSTYYTASNTPKYTWGEGYRAIEAYAANGNYISFAYFRGYIAGFYEAIKVYDDDASTVGSWISGITVLFDSSCVRGGSFNDCDVRISGLHQCTALLPYNDRGYFECNNTCCVDNNCVIYDTSIGGNSAEDKLFTSHYSIKAKKVLNGDFLYDIYSENAKTIKNGTAFTLQGNVFKHANLLPDAFYTTHASTIGTTGDVSSVVYKVFSTDEDFNDFATDSTKGTAISKDNTVGYYDLFYPDKVLLNHAGAQRISRKTYVNNVPVKIIYLKANVLTRLASIVVSNVFTAKIQSLIIRQLVSGVEVDRREFVQSELKDRLSEIVVPLYSNKTVNKTIEVITTYSEPVTNYDMPFIGICTSGAGDLIGHWGGYVYGDLNLNKATAEDFSFNKLDGSPVKGLADVRESITNNVSDGFNFYDKTIKKELYATEKQVEIDTWTIATQTSEYKTNSFELGKKYKIVLIGKTAAAIQIKYSTTNDASGIVRNIPGVSQDGNKVFEFTALSNITYPYILIDNASYSVSNFSVNAFIIEWEEYDGVIVSTNRSGTKDQRPVGSAIYVGFQYMQVDSTNGTFPIWASVISGDTVTWVKADGSDPDAMP